MNLTSWYDTTRQGSLRKSGASRFGKQFVNLRRACVWQYLMLGTRGSRLRGPNRKRNILRSLHLSHRNAVKHQPLPMVVWSTPTSWQMVLFALSYGPAWFRPGLPLRLGGMRRAQYLTFIILAECVRPLHVTPWNRKLVGFLKKRPLEDKQSDARSDPNC